MKIKTSQSVLLALLVVFCGALTCIMVNFTQSKVQEIYELNLPLSTISDKVNNNITKGHLWFEEFMAGDNSINLERDVYTLFQSSTKLLNTSLAGGESEIGKFEVLEDAESKRLIREAISEIDDFKEFAEKRRIKKEGISTADSSSKIVIGDDLDQLFDEKYEKIQEGMSALSKEIATKVAEDIKRVERYGNLMLIFIFIIFASLAFILFRVQSSNEKITTENKNKLKSEEAKIESMTRFADIIGQGNYEDSLTLETIEGDKLALALIQMKDKLFRLAEEDSKRNWSNVGLTKVAELSRTTDHEDGDFYYALIAFLVKYINANQGGLFLINDDNPNEKFVYLSACIAFDRKKFADKQLGITDGLIGRCIMEKEMIYLTEIPTGYLHIKSGLGDAPPKYLILLPIHTNDTISGVIEIASFYPIEEHQRNFLSKATESLGSTIASININLKTKSLLLESKMQTEELRAQEEEMKQNMEELAATQEEMQRKEKHYQQTIAELQQRLKENNISE